MRLQGTVETNESTGRVTDQIHGQPRTAVQQNQDCNSKAARWRRSPTRSSCGTATTKPALNHTRGTSDTSPLLDLHGRQQRRKRGLRLAAAVRADPEHGVAAHHRWRADELHVQPGAHGRQQYLSHVTTALPLGLVGKIPRCRGAPNRRLRRVGCPAESRIGTATTTVGSGSAPVQFSGPVYLTGPTRRAVRDGDRRRRDGRPIQPGQRDRAQQDRSQPVHVAGHGLKRSAQRSSRAFRCA